MDKTFRVFDLTEKVCIKNIMAHSQIFFMAIDDSETLVYLACDNQNVYCHAIDQTGSQKHKRTLQHKKRVTAICLSVDGQYLITGDSQGLLYIWSTSPEPLSAIMSNDNTNTTSSGLISTFELHKDKGAINNLVALHRPLSMYGLTANMNSYELSDSSIRPL